MSMLNEAPAGVTMADVARAAGVSVSTVSHVVNGTRNVSRKTALAVRAAIETTGYTHDRIARSLATGRTLTIGLAMSALSNPYFAEVAHAIEGAAAAAGYSLLLAETHDDPDHELRAIQDILGRRVDGIIIAPSTNPTATLKLLEKRRVPTVALDRVVDAEIDQVATENVAPTGQLVTHLAALGHERIAMVAGRRGLSTTEERIEGYQRALAAAGLPFDPDLLKHGESEDGPAEAALNQLLSLQHPPTALLVANNKMTIGVMRGLRQAGLQVPADIALVAFDDFEWADLFQPRLTTIAQTNARIGHEAVEMLLTRIADPSLPARKIRLEPRFVHRESCGCKPETTQS